VSAVALERLCKPFLHMRNLVELYDVELHYYYCDKLVLLLLVDVDSGVCQTTLTHLQLNAGAAYDFVSACEQRLCK
jgi:hypothetical protein